MCIKLPIIISYRRHWMHGTAEKYLSTRDYMHTLRLRDTTHRYLIDLTISYRHTIYIIYVKSNCKSPLLYGLYGFPEGTVVEPEGNTTKL